MVLKCECIPWYFANNLKCECIPWYFANNLYQLRKFNILDSLVVNILKQKARRQQELKKGVHRKFGEIVIPKKRKKRRVTEEHTMSEKEAEGHKTSEREKKRIQNNG